MLNDANRVEKFPLGGPCPNCESEDIVRLTGAEMLNLRRIGTIYLTRLICLTCGLSRECLDDFAHLTALRDAYAKRDYERGRPLYDQDTGIWTEEE